MSNLINKQDAVDIALKYKADIIAEEIEELHHVEPYNVTQEQIKEALKEIIEEERKSKWIFCSDRLPDMDGLYLVWADKSFIPDHADENNVYRGRYLATFNKTYCEWWGNNLENIYAWMPLPAPPEEINE